MISHKGCQIIIQRNGYYKNEDDERKDIRAEDVIEITIPTEAEDRTTLKIDTDLWEKQFTPEMRDAIIEKIRNYYG